MSTQQTKDEEQLRKAAITNADEFAGAVRKQTPTEATQYPGIALTVSNLSSIGASAPSELKDKIPETLRKLSGFPVLKKGVEIYLDENTITSLFQGLYVVTAATSKGKSITTAALTAAIVTLNDETVVTGTYFYVFEEGAPLYVGMSHGAGKGTLASISDIANLFSNPANFLQDAAAVVSIARAKYDKNTRLVFVFDSITLAVKAYDPHNNRAKSGTFEGGLQPADAEFFVDLGRICTAENVTIVGVVNPDVVPVRQMIEALVEGVIEVHGPGTFSKKERGSGRVSSMLVISKECVEMGAQALGYPPLGKQQKQTVAADLDHPFNRVPPSIK